MIYMSENISEIVVLWFTIRSVRAASVLGEQPNACFQRRRWQASESAQATARHHVSKSRPGRGPRQRRPLQSNVGPLR